MPVINMVNLLFWSVRYLCVYQFIRYWKSDDTSALIHANVSSIHPPTHSSVHSSMHPSSHPSKVLTWDILFLNFGRVISQILCILLQNINSYLDGLNSVIDNFNATTWVSGLVINGSQLLGTARQVLPENTDHTSLAMLYWAHQH